MDTNSTREGFIAAAGSVSALRGREVIVDGPRQFGRSSSTAQHWSGGDALLERDIRDGTAVYWTVIHVDDRTTACDGKRWLSSAGAERWLESALASREEFIHTAGGLGAAMAHETRTLSIGDEFLPTFARDVRDGAEGTPEYWAWLIASLEEAPADVQVQS